MAYTKKLIIIICILLLAILSGCWDRVEVNDIGIVLAAGYDLGDDGGYLLSIEVPLVGELGGPDGGGGGTGGDTSSYVDVAHGRTLREANANLQRQMARQLFYAHRRVIIVGEDLAKEGIRSLFDVVARVPENRLTTFLVVAKGKAEDTLRSQPHLERFASEAIRELVTTQGMQINLKDVAQILNKEGADTFLPYIETVSVHGSDQEEIRLASFALFKDDKMQKVLTEKEFQGIMWLKMDFQPFDLTFTPVDESSILEEKGKDEEPPKTVRIFKGDTKIRPIVNGDQITYQIQIQARGNLEEDLSKDGLYNKQLFKSVEEEMEKEIQESVELAIELMKEHNTDVANFGLILGRHYPRVWNEKFEENWYEQLDQLHFEIEVQAEVKRIGMIFQNIAEGLDSHE